MNNNKILLALILFSVSFMVYGQQDPLYNQYLFNQSMINPAYTGVNDVFNATAIGRKQWAGMEGAPSTNMLNTSTSLLNNKLGLGMLLIGDKYGVSSNIEIQLLYAYRIDLLNGKSLSFGLQTGYINYGYDYDKLTIEQADPALINNDIDVTKINFGTGVYYRTDLFYLGVSVPRMLNAEIEGADGTVTTYQRHFYLSAGYVFDQLIALKLKPSVLLKYVEGQPVSVDLNASLLVLESLWVGVSVRNFNEAGINGQFKISDQLRLGYAFGFPLNSISNNTFGTHELMVSFDMEIFGNHAIGRRYF